MKPGTIPKGKLLRGIISPIPQEDMIYTIPSTTLIYSLSFDEVPNIIIKEIKLYGSLDFTKIPHKNDSITFGDEIGCDCGFIVESVSRSQDKNEILVIGKHYGHDSGLVYSEMIDKYGFKE